MSKRFRELSLKALITAELPDDHSECEPPDPISNSEVKVLSADGSVGFPHVRVGHRQAPKYTNPKQNICLGFCAFGVRFSISDTLLLGPHMGCSRFIWHEEIYAQSCVVWGVAERPAKPSLYILAFDACINPHGLLEFSNAVN